jgi:hypothetical protein
MNWLTIVKGSIPEHSSNIADCLEYAMNTYEHGLSEIDLHGCALAAAIASGNGSLADEIAMNSPLFGKPEREIAKTAAATAAVEDVVSVYNQASKRVWEWHSEENDSRFKDALYAPFNGLEGSDVSYAMYCLAALMVYRNEVGVAKQCENLIKLGFNGPKITGIMQIAASVAAINRIIL